MPLKRATGCIWAGGVRAGASDQDWLRAGKEAVDLPSASSLQPGQFLDVVAVIVAAEVLGPLALIIGLWSRWTALVLIGFTAVTLWLTFRHAGVGVYRPRQNGEVLESLAIIGGLLFYFAARNGRDDRPPTHQRAWAA